MKSMFNRILAVCLTVLCLIGLSLPFGSVLYPPASAAAMQPQKGDAYIVRVKLLNVRSGPSVKSSVQTRLKKGTEVTYQKSEKGRWYVNYPNGSGYVAPRFLEKKGTGTETVAFTDPTATHVTRCNLRMRSEPSFKGKIVGVFKKGSRVCVLSQKGKWFCVRYGIGGVWVYTKYLKKK